jgi:hypothetical protein
MGDGIFRNCVMPCKNSSSKKNNPSIKPNAEKESFTFLMLKKAKEGTIGRLDLTVEELYFGYRTLLPIGPNFQRAQQ